MVRQRLSAEYAEALAEVHHVGQSSKGNEGDDGRAAAEDDWHRIGKVVSRISRVQKKRIHA